ncbi:MAG: acyclic terpene utilization AtuA family protein [Panacagrimonas sp.]
MSSRTVRIGGAAGYWGDTANGPEQLVMQGEVQYLVFDYLAEVTMAILAKARAKSPDAGYATDFVTQVIRPLAAEIAKRKIRVIANAGGVNLQACARAIRAALDEAGVALKVGIVEGDELLDRTEELRERGVREMFSGQPLPAKLASCNAYLGAFPIAAALGAGADIVVTGRVVDSAVTLGALIHEFGWQADDWDRLAAGTLAGHLIECGCQATGGNFTDWEQVAPDWDRMGFPIAECSADGSFVITKPAGTGGLVSPLTVGEQLVYEIDDPQAYLVPDVVCDFANVRLVQQGADRVHVSGVRGRPRTADYKVCATHDDGYRATFIQTLTSFDAPRRARANAEAILSVARRRLSRDGLPDFRDTAIHLIGTNTLWNPAYRPPVDANELVLRVDVWHERYAGCEVFSKEAAGAALSMTTGRCAAGPTGRPKTTPVVRPFSFLLPKTEVPVRVAVDGQAVAHDWQHFAAAPAMQPAPPLAGVEPRSAQGDAVTVPLLRLAVARSGDKGDKANIGVLARRPEYLPYISAALSADAVREWFAHTGTPRVDRYELPGLHALNFLLHDALGGGGAVSLRLDVQGKTYAQQLLHHPVTVPRALLDAAG